MIRHLGVQSRPDHFSISCSLQRPSPRYAWPPAGALQTVLSNASDGSAGVPPTVKALPSPRSTLGFSALSTLSSPRSSVGGSGSLLSPRPMRCFGGAHMTGCTCSWV